MDRERGNFFAYATDVAVLTAIQPRILSESPAAARAELTTAASTSVGGGVGGGVGAALDAARREEPEWLGRLGRLAAESASCRTCVPRKPRPRQQSGALLRELGIGRIVSVGERVSWRRGTRGWRRAGGSFYRGRVLHGRRRAGQWGGQLERRV